MTQKLSVVLATRNEEQNIEACLASVRQVADEIIVVDEESTDKTREIAQKFGAKVFTAKHSPIFHITKQKAIDKASGDWILQLDADERVTPALAKEVKEVINMSSDQVRERSPIDSRKWRLFQKHQKLIEQRDGSLGKKNVDIAAFFIPRANFFLGAPLIHAGVYPDGVIRLFKRGKARLPGKSVHEQMEVDGEIAWLFNDLEHHESPTLNRYVDRMNRYTDLHAEELKQRKVSLSYLNLFNYSFLIPVSKFLILYFRHLGFLDGMRGFIWSIFSALHFPIAYFKYWSSEYNSRK